MLYLSNELISRSPAHAALARQIVAERAIFNAAQTALFNTAQSAGMGPVDISNSAAILPQDAWRMIDDVTMRVMRNDEGQAYMTDLMALAKPVNIGKLAVITRAASDAGTVKRSLSGQTGAPVGKVAYNYAGTPVPIFDAGYGRQWREWATLQSENFDALADDQEAHVSAVRRDMADYVLNGDTSIVVDSYVGYGITTNPKSKSINLGSAAGGANIDLTSSSTTAEAIENFVNAVIGKAMDDNNLTGRKLNLYISPEIARNWDRPYSGATGFKEGSIRDVLLKNRRIAKIVDTFKLTGNAFFGFVADPLFIRPLVGMAVSTIAIPRTMPRDNYNFLVAGALGIEVRTDYAGRGGVFYSVVTN